MDFLKASKENIDELVDLRIAFLTDGLGELKEEDISAIRRVLPDYFVRHLGHDLHVYAAKEKKIVSCAFLLVIEKPSSPEFLSGYTGIVLNVFTIPAFRRQGLARRLMEMMLSDAKELGLDFVELKSTTDGYGLYKAVGFVDNITQYQPMKYGL